MRHALCAATPCKVRSGQLRYEKASLTRVVRGCRTSRRVCYTRLAREPASAEARRFFMWSPVPDRRVSSKARLRHAADWMLWMVAIGLLIPARIEGQCEDQKLLASDGTADAWFGSSVDLDDDYIVIGAPWHQGTGGGLHLPSVGRHLVRASQARTSRSHPSPR